MRIARPIVSLVLLVFATTAIYAQLQYVNDSYKKVHSWKEAIYMQWVADWWLIIPGLVIISFVIWFETRALRQADRESQRNIELHEQMVSSLERIERTLNERLH